MIGFLFFYCKYDHLIIAKFLDIVARVPDTHTLRKYRSLLRYDTLTISSSTRMSGTASTCRELSRTFNAASFEPRF